MNRLQMIFNMLMLAAFLYLFWDRNTMASYVLDSNRNVALEIGKDIFIPANEGLGLSFNKREENQKLFLFLGKHHDFELGELAFRDYNGEKVHVFGVCEYGIQGAAKNEGDVEVGFWISDPEGMIIQGKNSENRRHALQIKDGHSEFGRGKQLFSVTNDGEVFIAKAMGINTDSMLSTFDLKGSFGLSAKVSDRSISLQNETSYIYTRQGGDTWLLPELSGTLNRIYFLKNRGKGTSKVSASSNDLIYTSKEVYQVQILSGQSLIIQNDGQYWTMF